MANGKHVHLITNCLSKNKDEELPEQDNWRRVIGQIRSAFSQWNLTITARFVVIIWYNGNEK